ncbi:aminopeptidase Q-like isoform X2 [Linepithema humile]
MDLCVVQIQQESLRYDTSFAKKSKTLSKVKRILKIRKTRKHLKSRGVSRRSNKVSIELHYMKLFALWRMLQGLIPHNVFWTCIDTYARTQYNYSNTISDDLWTTMQAVLNVTTNTYKFDIKKVMDSWTRKNYYPLLNVTRNYKDSTMLISYVKSISNKLYHDDTTEDWISVTYTTQSLIRNINYLFWLNFPNHNYTVKNINSNDWVLVNIKQIGYYRVNYDTENWLKLARYLNSDNYVEIHVINRAQIVDDAFYFLMKKQLDFVTFWEIVSFLSRDTSYIAWHPMIKALEYMTCIFPFSNMPQVTEQTKILLNGLLQNIEENSDHDFTECLREEAIKWACIFRVPKCINISNSELTKHFADTKKYSPLAWNQWTYCKGFLYENYTWEKKWNEWLPADNGILEFFICFRNSQIFVQYWSHIKTKTFFRHVQVNKHANVFLLMIARHASNNIAFKYILEQFENIKPKKVSTIATLIVLITHIHDVFQLEKVHIFVKNKLEEKENKTLFRYVREKIRTRINEHAEKIINYGFYGSTHL